MNCLHTSTQKTREKEHPIFEPFKNGMSKLNDAGIPCFKYIVSAKSDSEMVYRGILTMIKDYQVIKWKKEN